MNRTLSKRERIILLATLGVVAVLAGDRYLVGPLLAHLHHLDAQRATLGAKLADEQDLVARAQRLAPQWAAWQGRLRGAPDAAESQVLHTVRDAAEAAGLKLSLLKPEVAAGKTALPRVDFQAAGTGSMQAVREFLWRLETTATPLRISDVQLVARKEGTDDLSLQVRLSTIWMPPGDAAASQTALAGPKEAP